MDGAVADNQIEVPGEVKTVKCSMCRKVKTADHFFNPNSDALFHVCDYCRYLRKTKYKKRRVRVELDRPISTFSRTRESSSTRSTRSYHSNQPLAPQSSTEKSDLPTSKDNLHMGIVPTKNWIDASSNKNDTKTNSAESKTYRNDNHYALNHPYYRYQDILISMCTPPQIVCNEKNQFVVVGSRLPPTPKSLIFCCKTPVHGKYFSSYNKQ